MRHGAPVYAASFSPDGRRILAATGGMLARLWDAESSKSVGEVMRHSNVVVTASFSPDGRRILTASLDRRRGCGSAEHQAGGRANAT